MAKRVALTDQVKADLRAIPQPIAIQILRTQEHRVIFRDLGDHIEVTRIRDRKDAYR